MAKIGYARVSSKEQNLDRQIKVLKEKGCKKIFTEKVSGKNIDDREQLKELLNFIREDDELIVISLDRLSRDNDDIDKILSIIQEKGATFTALDLPSFSAVEDKNMRKMLNNMILEVFKFTSQNEREKIRKRQKEGIELAKQRGVYKGSKARYRADTNNKKDRLIYETVIEMLSDNKRVAEIVKKTGISKNTVKSIMSREKP